LAADEEHANTRREVIIASVAGVVAVAIVGVLLITLAAREPSPEVPPKVLGSDTVPQTPKAAALPMAFSREGVAGEVATAVERVARPGRAQVALVERGGARWVCILADAGVAERYAVLDQGLSTDDFPFLQEGGFGPPPSHISRSSTSIYRSVAKRAMGYDPARGDRIVVLLCPKDQWDGLALAWPPHASQ
jgi:hypothetical protein